MSIFTVILVQLVISLVITAIAARLLSGGGIKAKKLDDFTFPTVSADRSIPIIVGDVLIEGPNVTWYGDFKTKKVKDGGGLFTPEVTVAIKYFVGMELVLGWGTINSISEIWFGDTIVWSGLVDSDGEAFEVSDPGAFGGEGKGGGVRADCVFYQGTSTQVADAYMTGRVGKAYAHRGISKIIWQGPSSEDNTSGLISESEFIQPIKIRAQHFPNFLGSSYPVVGTFAKGTEAANPAEVMYMLLTGRYSNVHSTNPVVPTIPDDLIDTTSFLDVALTTYNEDMGISFQWQRDTPVEVIVRDILEHVDGFLIEDSVTGKIKFTLNRQDYNPATAFVFDESNIQEMESYVRIGPTAAVNRLTAVFTDTGQAFKPIPINVEDLGNVHEQDAGSPGSLDLHMFHDKDAVLDRATKELVQLSEGIVSGKMITNRDAYDKNIGEVVKITWPANGVAELLVRIVKKKIGSLDSRSIEVDFVQDIFGIGTAIYSTPQGTNWVDIYNDPQDITTYKFMEEPLWMLEKFHISRFAHQVFLLTKFPTPDTFDYAPWISLNGAGYNSSLGNDFADVYSLTLAIPYSQKEGPGTDTIKGLRCVGQPPQSAYVNATFTQIKDEFKHWVLVNDELMAFETISEVGDGSWRLNTVYRGLLDTSPETHLVGSTVWFLDEGFVTLDYAFGDTDTFNIKTLTSASRGILDIANAAAKPWSITQRYVRPFRPAAVAINGGLYPDFIIGELSIGWNNRNAGDLGDLFLWDDPDEAEESGQTTTIKLYDSAGVLQRTVTGLSGNTYTYPLATEVTDMGSVQDRLTIEVYSVRDGFDSHSSFFYTVDRNAGAAPSSLVFDLDVAATSSADDVDHNLDVSA